MQEAGETLRERLLRERWLKPAAAVTLLVPVLEELGVAHRRGLAHGDFRPENVWIPEEGKATPCGLVVEEGKAPTRPGAAPDPTGAYHYLAPERMRGGEGDFRSDLYACAIVLYEMLAAEVFPVRLPIAKVPEKLSKALERALAIEADLRFQSTASMIFAFEDAVAVERLATPPAPIPDITPGPEWGRRIGLAVAVAVVGIGGALLFRQAQRKADRHRVVEARAQQQLALAQLAATATPSEGPAEAHTVVPAPVDPAADSKAQRAMRKALIAHYRGDYGYPGPVEGSSEAECRSAWAKADAEREFSRSCFDWAVESCNRALSYDPNDPDTYLLRAASNRQWARKFTAAKLDAVPSLQACVEDYLRAIVADGFVEPEVHDALEEAKSALAEAPAWEVRAWVVTIREAHVAMTAKEYRRGSHAFEKALEAMKADADVPQAILVDTLLEATRACAWMSAGYISRDDRRLAYEETQGALDVAFDHLNQAIALDHYLRGRVSLDEELRPLQDDPRWKHVLHWLEK